MQQYVKDPQQIIIIILETLFNKNVIRKVKQAFRFHHQLLLPVI